MALASCYFKLGRTNDTVTLMEHLLTIDPSLPLAHRVLGQLATMQGKLSKAEDYYRTSLKLNPEQYETRLELARLLRRESRTEELWPAPA